MEVSIIMKNSNAKNSAKKKSVSNSYSDCGKDSMKDSGTTDCTDMNTSDCDSHDDSDKTSDK